MTQEPDRQEREAQAATGATPSTSSEGHPATLQNEAHGQKPAASTREAIYDLDDVGVAYGGVPAVREVNFPIYQHE
ncbi:MAG: hypothetical protein M3350_09055, partial [Actinomycetota bacterium]|nr:hypothetical protein [Actinomycetota bacterium]